MCMFDKMFEEGGHKFRKRSPQEAATVTNRKVTMSYDPSKDNFARNVYEGVQNWRSIPPTGYKWKSLYEQAEQAEDEKPFSYLAIVSSETHEDGDESVSSEKKKKKIKKEKHKKKHSKHKKQKKDKKKRDKKKKENDKKMKKRKHKKSKHKDE